MDDSYCRVPTMNGGIFFVQKPLVYESIELSRCAEEKVHS